MLFSWFSLNHERSLEKNPTIIIISFFITFIFIGVLFYISSLLFLIMDAILIYGIITLVIIFGDLTDVWNLCFLWVFVVGLFHPHLSMRYPAYWSYIIWCVYVLFPSWTLIFSISSAISSLVAKLMTTMEISKEFLLIFLMTRFSRPEILPNFITFSRIIQTWVCFVMLYMIV